MGRATILFVTLCLVSACKTAPPIQDVAGLDTLLAALGLGVDDVTLRADYVLDPYRLRLNERLLTRPFDAEAEAARMNDHLRMPLRGALLLAYETLGDTPSPTVRSPPAFRDAMRRARESVPTVRPSGDWFSMVHPESTLTQPELDGFLNAARSVDVLAMLHATRALFDALEPLLMEKARGDPHDFGADVVFGTTGRDTFRNAAAVIVDPGGDDVYVAVGVASANLPVQIVIDLAGDDLYRGAVGVGNGGIALVIDMVGNDRYEANGVSSQGVGVGGVGVLWDRAGNDVYQGGPGSQGFGLFGVGVLVDESGEDHYVADYLAQGASGPGGVGVLVEVAGDDRYRAGGRFKDFREQGKFYQSMSQGYSLGLRYSASGGLGLLCDQAGADTYDVAYFGQGAAHWGGVGVLIDRSGSDQYRARRYAQGAGTHIAAGLLVDESGDDHYSIDGVGQGAGHNLSLGSLLDLAGDDTYDGRYLCQGVGNANGIGILYDREGNDAYKATGEDVQGHGDRFRAYGSIGLMLDDGGQDRFDRARHYPVWISGTGGGADW